MLPLIIFAMLAPVDQLLVDMHGARHRAGGSTVTWGVDPNRPSCCGPAPYAAHEPSYQLAQASYTVNYCTFPQGLASYFVLQIKPVIKRKRNALYVPLLSESRVGMDRIPCFCKIS
jgi:hypothetical protein